MLERIIAAAHMNEHNAFDDDDDDDDDDYDRGDDGDGNLDGDVNMDSVENLGDNAGNVGSDGRYVGSDGVNLDHNAENLCRDGRDLGDDGGNEGADSGNVDDDGGNLVSEGESSDEGSSDPEIVDFVPPPVISNSNQPGCSGSKDYQRNMDDSSADTAFASLIENLSTQSRKLGRVMQFVRDWVLLKILSETMREIVLFDQLHTKPSVCRVNVADIEINVRCQAPNDMLRSGLEPLKVRGDGNCLFRSVSVAVTDDQSECLHQWLKLWCIVHGCLNEHFYIKQFLADADRVDGFLSLITDDDIYGRLSDEMTMKEKVSYVYQREIMKTSVDGRYSGYLQIVLLAGLLKTSFYQHCSAPGYGLYNTEICPPSGSMDSIHLLWCHLSGGMINHIVPMLRCETDEHINTFSDNFDTVCAASSKCQFVHNLDSAARERWILCEQCLLWYHESCVYYTKERSLPARWFCGCTKQPECIWYCVYIVTIHCSFIYPFWGFSPFSHLVLDEDLI